MCVCVRAQAQARIMQNVLIFFLWTQISWCSASTPPIRFIFFSLLVSAGCTIFTLIFAPSRLCASSVQYELLSPSFPLSIYLPSLYTHRLTTQRLSTGLTHMHKHLHAYICTDLHRSSTGRIKGRTGPSFLFFSRLPTTPCSRAMSNPKTSGRASCLPLCFLENTASHHSKGGGKLTIKKRLGVALQEGRQRRRGAAEVVFEEERGVGQVGLVDRLLL